MKTVDYIDFIGDTLAETKQLIAMGKEGVSYLESFEWCPPISSTRLRFGIGVVVATMTVRLSKPIDGDVMSLWVVVGDLPSAYLALEEETDPSEVLNVYCELMRDWCKAVEKGKSLSDVFPVRAERTLEACRDLLLRVSLLEEKIIPSIH